jgi:hypothetical protein
MGPRLSVHEEQPTLVSRRRRPPARVWLGTSTSYQQTGYTDQARLRQRLREAFMQDDYIAHRYATTIDDILERAIHMSTDSNGVQFVSMIMFSEIPVTAPVQRVIARVRELELLSLENCSMEEVVQDIGALSNLHTLNLSDNRLTRLPESFAGLRSLRMLIVASNRLTVLPNALMRMTQLETLSVSNNHLTSLPPLDELQHLTLINATANEIATVPDWLADVRTAGFRIIISNHPLPDQPAAIGALVQAASGCSYYMPAV